MSGFVSEAYQSAWERTSENDVFPLSAAAALLRTINSSVSTRLAWTTNRQHERELTLQKVDSRLGSLVERAPAPLTWFTTLGIKL